MLLNCHCHVLLIQYNVLLSEGSIAIFLFCLCLGKWLHYCLCD
uniref:Uncharacterized protein n=1 Tax=Rhizophora mucronata TaxID=61149 RepID=A0A2P2Q137_RHIMU